MNSHIHFIFSIFLSSSWFPQWQSMQISILEPCHFLSALECFHKIFWYFWHPTPTFHTVQICSPCPFAVSLISYEVLQSQRFHHCWGDSLVSRSQHRMQCFFMEWWLSFLSVIVAPGLESYGCSPKPSLILVHMLCSR